MKRLLPLTAVIAAMAAVALIAVVTVGASSGAPEKNVRQSEDSGGPPVGAMCAKDVPDCNDIATGGEGVAGTCLEGSVDCADTMGGSSTNMCVAEDNPGAGDPIAAPECNDITDGASRCAADAAPDCGAIDTPGIAIDPICVDDGTGACIDGGTSSSPPSGPLTSYNLTIVFNESVTQVDLDETAKVIEGIAPDSGFLIRESFPPVGAVTMTTDMASFCTDMEAKLESSSYIADVTCSPAANVDPPCCKPDDPVSNLPADGSGVNQSNPGSAPRGPASE